MKDYIPLDPKAPWAEIFHELGIQEQTWDGAALHEVCSRNAKDFGENPALQFFDRTINYQELETLSQRLANGLAGLGLVRGDVVGLHIPNSPQYVISLLAISRLGLIGSGVSLLLTKSEIQYQIQDAGMKALITLDALSDAVGPVGDLPECMRFVIETSLEDHLTDAMNPAASAELPKISYASLFDQSAQEVPPVQRAPNDTFMIQYTGGTTGRPKGAELTVESIMSNPKLGGSGETPWDIGNEVVISPFPMFHIAGLAGIVTGLQSGGHTLLVTDPRDVDGMCQMLKKFPPTRIGAVPALYQMMIANPIFQSVDFSRLQLARSGAAPMPNAVFRDLENIIGKEKFADAFGMTETSPSYTIHPPKRYKAGSVGIPMPGASVKIMDVETGTKEMPIGEAGEICCAGPQLMKGYLNLPDESAHALREMDGRRWMYTGDVGYMDEEGYIFLCDRAKDMLIVGGFKVFSVEVEDKLHGLPSIEKCALVGTPDEARPGNDIVVLFIQRAPDAPETDEEIASNVTAYCRKEMAPYKVPKRVLFVDEIPLTPIGKIDKKLLRTMI